jgi:small-conductance mechanosensitive channel
MLSQNKIRIGDLVEVNGILGRIITIDMRATMLQALDGSMVTIKNQTMLDSVWTSYSAHPFRRMELLIGVAYETDLKAATSIVKGIISKYKDIVPKPEPTILVDEFDQNAIRIKVWFWVEITKPFFIIRSNLAYRIKKAFDKVGISITCPVRIIKFDEDDRVLLKTVDSIKKGIVPEPKAPVPVDKLAEAAVQTETMQTIPFNIFETPKAPEPVPVPVAPPTSMQAPKSDPDRKPVPPPTHL